MDIKKLNPWNWFNKEEETEAQSLPVRREAQQPSEATPQVYNPFTGVAQLHQQIDRMFDNMVRGFGLPSLSSWGLGGFESPFFTAGTMGQNGVMRPKVDIAANAKEYTVTVEVPGVEEKDVKLELSADGTLMIRGEKKQEKEEKESNFYRVERSYGSFQRVLSLPQDVEREQISAAFKQGVLTITLPRKAEAQTESRNIEIRTAA